MFNIQLNQIKKATLKKRPNMVFKTNRRLMQAKSIAECSGEYFEILRPVLSYHFTLSILAVLHRFHCAYTISVSQ